MPEEQTTERQDQEKSARARTANNMYEQLRMYALLSCGVVDSAKVFDNCTFRDLAIPYIKNELDISYIKGMREGASLVAGD